MFARLATGGQQPARTVFGQNSKLSRTMHDIRYDAVYEEIVVPVPYAQAILTFRGGADGQEAPIRIMQGQKTGAIGSRLEVEPTDDEISSYTGNTVTFYSRQANYNVAPLLLIDAPD